MIWEAAKQFDGNSFIIGCCLEGRFSLDVLGWTFQVGRFEECWNCEEIGTGETVALCVDNITAFITGLIN